MTSSDNELHLFLGRVEGKLDALVASLANHGLRLDRVDNARQDLADRITILETRRATLKDWGALLISVASLLVVAYSNLKGLFH